MSKIKRKYLIFLIKLKIAYRYLFGIEKNIKKFILDSEYRESLFDDEAKYMFINFTENLKQFTIEVIVPGFEQKDIKVVIKKTTINIFAKYNDKIDKDSNYHRQDFIKRSFEKTLNIPDTVDYEKIKAAVKNGILKIDLPKRSYENYDKTLEIN